MDKNREKLIQLGCTDQQIDEFDSMNERETKEFFKRELARLGCTDRQIDEFNRQFKPRWHYYPWDPRSGRYGGTVMGILMGTAIFYAVTCLTQN